MDMFMDKLAQKLTAQEIIKANTAADTEELNRLKNSVAEYNECLDKLQRLVDEGSARLASAQPVDSSAVNRLVEESINKINEIKSDTEKLEQQQRTLTEQQQKALAEQQQKALTEQQKALTELQKALTEQQKALTEQLDSMNRNISDKLEEKLGSGSGDEQLSKRMDEIEESVHRECVKVYRNVQAVVVEEGKKQDTLMEETAGGVKSFGGKVKILLGISVGTLIISMIGTILQVLNALNIYTF